METPPFLKADCLHRFILSINKYFEINILINYINKYFDYLSINILKTFGFYIEFSLLLQKLATIQYKYAESDQAEIGPRAC